MFVGHLLDDRQAEPGALVLGRHIGFEGALQHRLGEARLGAAPVAALAGDGHHGLGGSIGFGDPDARLGFSYCCNQMHAVGTNGPRARRLIDAVYSAL